jgi:hypothetical protein
MTHAAAAPVSPHHGHSIGFNLGIIAVGVAILGVALAYLITAAGHSGASDQERGMVARALGATRLTIPAAWVTDPSSTASFAREVDLSVSLPLGPDGSLRQIDVTLTERSRVTPSASLLDGVYLHEFKSDQLSGPPGLIGKPLQAEEGFESETIWYDPLTSSPFVAKCAAPIIANAAPRCLRTVYLGPGLAAIYSFDGDVLGNWRKFDAEMHPLLNRIGAL